MVVVGGTALYASRRKTPAVASGRRKAFQLAAIALL